MTTQHLLTAQSIVLCLLFSGVVFAGEAGLAGHYTSEEGSGHLLRDHTANTVATHPGFQSLFGLYAYRSNYADEETIR